MKKGLIMVFIGIVAIPLFIMTFEIFGMIVNHASTGVQTNRLRRNIVNAIPNTKIISSESRTGNTSGTGNHVDCLTQITFTSTLSLSDVRDKLDNTYDWNDSCYVKKTEKEGEYLFFLLNSAPFADNIEGH